MGTFKTLKIACINVNSILNKKDGASIKCQELNLDIFCVVDTFLCPSHNDSIVNINGYALHRNDFISYRPMYGVCCYVKDGIKVTSLPPNDNLPNTLTLFFPDLGFTLCTVYRPPSNTILENSALVALIERLSTSGETLFVGDFNLPTIKWRSGHSVVNQPGLSAVDREFFNLFATLGLRQWIDEPTFIYSDNTLDLILTTESDRILNAKTIPPFHPKCGHLLIVFEYLFQSLAINSQNRSSPNILQWSKADNKSIRRELLHIDWDYEFLNETVSTNYSSFLNMTSDIINRHVPVVPQRPRNPWKPKPCPSMKRRLSEKWNDYKSTRTLYGRSSTQASTKLLIFKQQLTANDLDLKGQRKAYEEHLVDQLSSNPKKLHGYIRDKKKCRPSVGPLRIDDALTDNPHHMAEALATTFSAVFDDSPPPDTIPHQQCNSQISQCYSQVAKVKSLLSKLKNGSSPGPDGVTVAFLKRFSPELGLPLSLIFNTSMESSELPIQFKMARVSPIFKGKGSRADPSNYRPISLTSIPCKVMEKVVFEHLMTYFEENSILIPNQFGFRPKRSTVDQLLQTYETITNWYDQGKVVDLVLFDYSKAFDRVNHGLLLKKLKLLGVAGCLLGWMESFLVNRNMFVSVGAGSSESKNVASGVPQGSVLGPLLFLIFVNHLTTNLSSDYAFFADDLKIFFTTDTTENTTRLQRDIDTLAQISADWGLQFNVGKTVNLRFQRTATPNVSSIFTLNNSPIAYKHSHSDLGIIIDSTLRFHEHVFSAATKAGGVALNLLKGTQCRSKNFMLTLLTTHIRPVLEYGSQVWNTGFVGDSTILESVQRRWTKKIDGMSELTYRDRLHQLDLFSVKGRLWRADMIYCWKLFQGLSPLTLEHFFAPSPNVGTRGHPHKLFVPHSSTEARRRFFSHRIIADWNALPRCVVESSSLGMFKNRLASLCGGKLSDYTD